ncbi:hypothetical protein BJ138DRAFT_1189738 [Hygrophoropsis aurantiaca]|uniref:Uncharacterized protein n=1 Tax=Hygrophoropsis aurantiaca TaxID=72124 RepID=A0ACB8APL5_9AGAM|nr:hypothetical protein BJ138DRAFT_1189738 [Hygrophoropsis aurantiaca]
MGDIQNRPFSKNYSGLVNQSVIAVGLTVLCVTSHEIMKRRRRGRHPPKGLGSVESWEFGYLYQARSWALNPSPPTPKGCPLSWVKQCLKFPQDDLCELRGVDATLYVRFLRGCFYFILTHTFTTLPILLPIHVHFSDDSVSPASMTRASIASLVLTPQGLSLLWIHICLLFWLTLTWIATLVYICRGAFKFRAIKIETASKSVESDVAAEKDAQFHPHPHPQFPFQDIPSLDNDRSNRGLRLRTVMVSNVPTQLRSEAEMKEYFEYYMSRPIDKPSVGLSSSTQPGFINKFFAFGFNRAKRIPQYLPQSIGGTQGAGGQGLDNEDTNFELPSNINPEDIPVIERVVIARRMTELASLLERREDILRRLETAHIKLAKKALLAVYYVMEHRRANSQDSHHNQAHDRDAKKKDTSDLERGQSPAHDDVVDNEEHMDLLINTLSPFVAEFDLPNVSDSTTHKAYNKSKRAFRHLRIHSPRQSGHDLAYLTKTSNPSPTIEGSDAHRKTIWDALLSLPRSALHPYQPLIHLSVLFRGKTVPSIDYYTAKLNLLTSLITQNRARAVQDYHPVSTAFVTFADPKDARKACKYLAVHPNNPLACLVTMAPQYEDIDWTRVMKTTYRGELLKDWMVNIGVWGFTIFWLFPLSLFVGLVSIQSISTFWPSLYSYLSRHPWQEEVIQSFLPTLLISLLTILIPLLLLLIAKKAHTITTLSVLHDTIMTRYYKFLIVNVLVFFCVGTAALQSFLTSFKNVSGMSILTVVANSFPTAGPFYVGWLIFTTAIHGCFELVLFGLPLFVYPSTKRQITPRKRAVGIRPRTFNFYYWLPNHLLIIHVLLLFAILNPLVIPFGLLYFTCESAVVKNQLLHVYAKNYEGNGQLLLIRMVRYSFDGLILSQCVFLAYMVVLKKTVNVGLSAFLVIFTVFAKVIMTRQCRSRFEMDDILEADVICRTGNTTADVTGESDPESGGLSDSEVIEARDEVRDYPSSRFLTWRIPEWANFSYMTNPRRIRHPQRRQPNPFGPQRDTFSRINSAEQGRAAEVSHPSPDKAQTVLDKPLKPLHPTEEFTALRTLSTSLVQRHPPLPAWDDNAHYDIPYDNPYYTRPISNFLWLPRDPFGLLNLDDTVDVRRYLTSELVASDLGIWFGPQTSSISPLQQTPNSIPDDEQLHAPEMGKYYSGQEDIDLPPGIRSRVLALEREEEVEQATRERRPSVFSRRSNASGQSSGLRLARGPGARSQTLDARPNIFHKSSSDVMEQARRRTSSYLPPLDINQRSQMHFRGVDPGSHPDLHAQAEFLRSAATLATVASRSRTNNVSTREAVAHEVIVEEQMAAEARLKKEGAEVSKPHSQNTRSWLTSWIYSKVH